MAPLQSGIIAALAGFVFYHLIDAFRHYRRVGFGKTILLAVCVSSLFLVSCLISMSLTLGMMLAFIGGTNVGTGRGMFTKYGDERLAFYELMFIVSGALIVCISFFL